MRRRILQHEIFRQETWADHDDVKYKLYLAALLTNLFQVININDIYHNIASIFKEYSFWQLQISGAQQLNRKIGPRAPPENVAEELKKSPAWLICRLLPTVQSCAQDKAFFTTRYVFLPVYLPLSVLSKVI